MGKLLAVMPKIKLFVIDHEHIRHLLFAVHVSVFHFKVRRIDERAWLVMNFLGLFLVFEVGRNWGKKED